MVNTIIHLGQLMQVTSAHMVDTLCNDMPAAGEARLGFSKEDIGRHTQSVWCSKVSVSQSSESS